MLIITKNLIIGRKAVTLMEIMVALLIMAFAFMPIIGVIGTSTKDTDVANATVFAQTTARNILDALLDDVPFNSIKNSGDDNIASIEDYGDYKVDSFLSMIGSSDGKAVGEILDDRGIKYDITIYVWPIKTSDKADHLNDELVFSYLPRPIYEEGDNWYTYSNKFLDGYSTDTYDISLFPEVATISLNAYEFGAKVNASGDRCIMKKILFKMKWTCRDGIERVMDLYTMKANLDSDGKAIGG